VLGNFEAVYCLQGYEVQGLEILGTRLVGELTRVSWLNLPAMSCCGSLLARL
jgi:hypothetical protein